MKQPTFRYDFRRERPTLKHLLRLLLLFFVVALVICLPVWWLAGWLAARFGWAPGAGPVLLAGVLWLALAWALYWALFHLMLRFHKPHDVHKPYNARTAQNFYSQTVEALDRIAAGDFNVLLEPQSDRLWSPLAEKINHMARELASMENMRQEFVANVSHEIQSPLTSISGYAALLQKPDIDAAKRDHYLEVIASECTRLSKLSDDLLRLSALDSGTAALSADAYRLDKQLSGSLLLLEPQWVAKGLEVSLETSELVLEGDRALLEQVWANLLHNAVKFTPGGGTVSVAAWEEDGKAVVTVADTGPGIPEAEALRVFERFYKVDKARDRAAGGNGLGLSLAHKIVALHKGNISLQSKEGEGTVFRVELPLQQ